MTTTTVPGLLGELLAAQRQATAVDAFSRAFDAAPRDARAWRDLIPAATPGHGEQYAFEVDLDECSGCKACVTACHSMNGLDRGETWRRVGTLLGADAGGAVRQTVTASCHHCVEPACLRGCPVRAYEKDPITGIVSHLDDQCIGCKYCLFTCPYDVPRYSAERGIVRKCDMCKDRLAGGEAPACVQACPSEAIAIHTVTTGEVADAAETGAFLPAAPDPGVTLPTTSYRRAAPLPRNTVPADYYVVRREDAHLPLAAMLVLTQVAVGLTAAAHIAGEALPQVAGRASILSLVVAIAALGASLFHLGRPQHAYRALLGLRTSWLSREIVAFGGFVALLGAYAVALRAAPGVAAAAGVAATVTGAGAVHTSVMVYVATRRPCWRPLPTAFAFYMTAVSGGTAVLAALAATFAAADGAPLPPATGVLAAVAAAVGAAKLLGEAAALARVSDRRHTAWRRRAELLFGGLRGLTRARFLAGISGVAIAAAFAATASGPASAATAGLGWAAAVLLAGGDLVERHLFFVAAAAPRMPGNSP